MKTLLIRVAIILFIRWLEKNKDRQNNLLARIFGAKTPQELINAIKYGSTKNEILDIINDIEGETISNLFSDIIEK